MTTYRYVWSRTGFSPDLEKVVPSYPQSKVTNISVNKQDNGDLNGLIYFLTEDDFIRIKEFYKKEYEHTDVVIDDEEDLSLVLKKNSQKIRIYQSNEEWEYNKIAIQFMEA